MRVSVSQQTPASKCQLLLVLSSCRNRRHSRLPPTQSLGDLLGVMLREDLTKGERQAETWPSQPWRSVSSTNRIYQARVVLVVALISRCNQFNAISTSVTTGIDASPQHTINLVYCFTIVTNHRRLEYKVTRFNSENKINVVNVNLPF